MPENPLLTPAKIAELPKFAKFIQAAAPGRLQDMKLREAILEPKLDGHRLLAYVGDDGQVTLLNRNGIDKTALLPHICAELATLPAGTWVDGEAVGDGDTWNTVQSVLGADTYRPDLAEAISFTIFDMLVFDGLDMRREPLKRRRAFGILAFNDLVDGGGGFGYCSWVPQYPVNHDVFEKLAAQYEGAIVKDQYAPYASGKRGHGWFKLKNEWTMDVVVVGMKPGKGKYLHTLGALVFGQRLPGFDVLKVPEKEIVYHDGHRYAIRGAASGMTDELRDEFFEQHQRGELVGTVIEVAHNGVDLSEAGKVRHPRFKRVRTDKTPAECDWRDK